MFEKGRRLVVKFPILKRNTYVRVKILLLFIYFVLIEFQQQIKMFQWNRMNSCLDQYC